MKSKLVEYCDRVIDLIPCGLLTLEEALRGIAAAIDHPDGEREPFPVREEAWHHSFIRLAELTKR